MMRVAAIMTVHNRKDKTLRCLDSLGRSIAKSSVAVDLSVFITDDGSTDGTAASVKSRNYPFQLHLLYGDGTLFWNGGMINSWKSAIDSGAFDGYLLLNDDVVVLPEFWMDVAQADEYSLSHFGKHGIYVGSTRDGQSGSFTYGGFNYVSKWTLLDKFVQPDGASFQQCEAAHANITYVSADVVKARGIFCGKYFHGGSDHDYTYLAHKAGIPLLVLPHYAGECGNDHSAINHSKESLSVRLNKFTGSKGYNFHNALLFNRRCFPYRVPFVFVSGLAKILLPKTGYGIYHRSHR